MRVSWLADERHSKESCDVSVKEYALIRATFYLPASPTNYLDANNHTCDSPLRVFKNALNEVTKKGKGINNKSRSCYTDLWHIPVQINVIQLTRPHERA
ncbi:hypothetical protein POVWA2_005070 [Plasmodium ovale wallikeri]|uniref:Uncharacterized protein n=1 Tax=Plasmodium ovale wallikeri TaxID=864142 RepID=A0A1A8YJT6_PLAOA|nr:hypothetical protein POVWA2_005070 [Plasmodium ovale wallikeri]